MRFIPYGFFFFQSEYKGLQHSAKLKICVFHLLLIVFVKLFILLNGEMMFPVTNLSYENRKSEKMFLPFVFTV